MIISKLLRKLKRKIIIKYYGLKNVHPEFLATFGWYEISKDLVAGAYSYIGPRCRIYSNVIIGNFTLIANDVFIIGGDHDVQLSGIPLPFSGRKNTKKTIIGDDVWIGARSIIMCGVHIGNGAIIAAGSVVTHDIAPYSIVGGIPAKFIKKRFNEEEIQKHEQILAKPIPFFKEYASNLVSGKI